MRCRGELPVYVPRTLSVEDQTGNSSKIIVETDAFGTGPFARDIRVKNQYITG